MTPTPRAVNSSLETEDYTLTSDPRTKPHLDGQEEVDGQGQETRDSGYAWVVCAASFVSQTLQGGQMYSMGMFYIVFKDNFKGDASSISLISSISAASAFGAAPIAGLLFSKFGGRIVGITGTICVTLGLILSAFATEAYQLYLTFGVLTGFGMALQYNPCLSILAIYFDKRLGMATGLACSGAGLGSIIFPYFVKILNDEYGWQGALIINGAIQLHSAVCCALFRPLYTEKTIGTSESGTKNKDYDSKECEQSKDPAVVTLLEKKSNREECDVGKQCDTNVEQMVSTERKRTPILCLSVFRAPQYIIYCISQFLMNFSVSIIYIYLGAYSKSLNYTEDDAAALYFALGVSTTVMRIVVGFLLQIPWCRPLAVYSISQIILGIVTLLFSFYTTFPLLIMYGALYGIFSAPFNTFNLNIAALLVPADAVSSALGILLLFLAPGSLFGAPLAGLLYDRTGLFLSSFYLAGATMVFSGLVTSPLCRENGVCGGKNKMVQKRIKEVDI